MTDAKNDDYMGQKIPVKDMSYIDTAIITIGGKLNPIFKKLNFSPNTITTFSILISFVGIYKIYQGSYKTGAIFFFIGYMFDCWDGQYARKYNLVTKFGDLYDHIGDISKAIILYYVLFNLNIKHKHIIITGITISFIITLAVLGCQEEYNKDNTVLRTLQPLCNKKIYDKYNLKILENGTMFFIVCLILFNIEFISKL